MSSGIRGPGVARKWDRLGDEAAEKRESESEGARTKERGRKSESERRQAPTKPLHSTPQLHPAPSSTSSTYGLGDTCGCPFMICSRFCFRIGESEKRARTSLEISCVEKSTRWPLSKRKRMSACVRAP